jgi:hypothetical protein
LSIQSLLTWFAVLTLALICSADVRAQTSRSTAHVSISNDSELSVQIKLVSPSARWSFLNSYAGAVGLGERIKNFEALSGGRIVPSKRIASGEYRVDDQADALNYKVEIPPSRPGDLAHVSWLTRDSGLLFLADLLPDSLLNEHTIDVSFDLPTGLNVASGSTADGHSRFVVTAPEKGVFIVGATLDAQSSDIHGGSAKVVLSDKWGFSGKQVLKSAIKVADSYSQLTGSPLNRTATILIGAMPKTDSSATWKAETRGSTVVLLLNANAPVKNWVGQIGIILTHELFHMWIPNALSMSGDYDRFFEGFTLYVALQTALQLKLINFQEYLDTLARVYDSYLSYADEQSLIEASERRWTSAVPVVYDKGMLVAFLYDLTIKQESSEGSSLLAKYKMLFSTSVGERSGANDVIIRLLTSSPATADIANSYISGRKRLELEKLLPTFGFQVSADGPKSRLSVRKDLDIPQKHLMRSLGYRK